jgi:hypothetical protein
MKLKVPKIPFKPVKVTRAIIPEDAPWRIENGDDIDEQFQPNKWLLEAMGVRLQRYFLGRRHVDEGWGGLSHIRDGLSIGRPAVLCAILLRSDWASLAR